MSVLSISLNSSSLATVGISAANPSQLSAIRDTVNGTTTPTSSAATAKAADSASTAGNKRAAQEDKAAKDALTPEELRRIAELERIDSEVRAHEQAHINVGRGLITSGPDYDYVYGPDGKRYAVSGEVGIDTSPEQKPQANIDKGQHIQETALAPVDPSPQDYRVAATGKRLEERGHSDLREEQRAATEAAAEAQREGGGDARLRAYAPLQSAPQNVLDTYA